MKALLTFYSICLLAACSAPKTEADEPPHLFDDARLREMYNLANRESWDSLMLNANSSNAAYRLAFAKIMGSAQLSQAQPSLRQLLNDPEPYVQLYAAWAIGQYGDSIASPVLWSAFDASPEPEVRAELLIAIGKCGVRQAAETLLAFEPTHIAEELSLLWGIYATGLRGHLFSSDLPAILPYLQSPEAESRLAVAHILQRSNVFDLQADAKTILAAAQKETDADVRSVLAAILPNGDAACLAFRAQLAITDPSPAVRSKALIGFPVVLNEEGKAIFRQALEDEAPWVAMAAAQRLDDFFSLSDTLYYDQLAARTEIPELGAALMKVYFRRAETIDRAEALWRQNVAPEIPPIHAAVFVRNLPFTPTSVDTLVKYLRQDGPLGTAAAEALLAQALANAAAAKRVIPEASYCFERGTASQSAVFAEALTDKKRFQKSEIPLSSIRAAIDRFSSASQLEAREMLIKAHNTWTGEKLSYPRPPTKPIDWELVRNIPSSAHALIYTSEGIIETALLIDDAPGSTANFVSLSQTKFYDGLGFHRIVPGFVSQGGDPQKDGFGSTDYLIRSEFSPLQFGPGVLGYASLGANTEGCQFFFTHTSTPHLNGRYTIFGALTGGWETMEAIHTATVIDSIRVVY